MADRSFGVREIAIIGAGGTPTIESPGAINLDSHSVAISTDASIGRNLTVVGITTVGVVTGGTYYGNGAGLTGISGLSSVFLDTTPRLGGDLDINSKYITGSGGANITGVITATTFKGAVTGDVTGNSDTATSATTAGYATTSGISTTSQGLTGTPDVTVQDINNRSVNASGIITAVNLKSTTSAVLNGLTYPTSDGSLNEVLVTNGSGTLSFAGTPLPDHNVAFVVTANGASAYRISGGGSNSSTDNPTINLFRGFTYRFQNQAGAAHPFEIRLGNNGNAVTAGIAGTTTGFLFYTPQQALSAGTAYVYQCTQHPGMVGTINIL